MRVWGRIEGCRPTSDDPLDGPTMVYGFIDVPSGSKVDLAYQGREVRAQFVSDTEYTATFSLGKNKPPLTLSHAEYTVCVRRENDGFVCPDRQQRVLRKIWDARIEGGIFRWLG